jgi:hypothetical protein
MAELEIIPPDDKRAWPEGKRVGDGTGGPGRRPGSQNKLTRLLREAVIEAAENVGKVEITTNGKNKATRKGGLVGYLETLAIHQPKTFGTLLAKIIPLQVQGHFEVQHNPLNELLEQINGRTRAK